MKTAERLQLMFVLATILLVTAVIAAGAYRHLVPAEAAIPMETVTVTATRMSQQEKTAYDVEQAGYVQTVVISVPRMTAEEKQAWLELRQQSAQTTVAVRHRVVPTI